MASILIGSSNIYRNFDRAIASGRFSGRDLQLVRCTKKAAFDAHLVTLDSASLVITSVLENFISDVCSGVQDDEVQLFSHQQISAHVEELFGLVSRLPDVVVLIMPPLYRGTPAWFGPYLTDFHNFLATEVGRLGSSRMAICPPFLVLPSMLEEDGIHLVPEAGDRLLAHLDTSLGSLLTEVSAETQSDSPMVSSPQASSNPPDRLNQILDAVNRNSQQMENLGSLGRTVSAIAQTSTEFEVFVRKRFKDDDLIFARLKEESDTAVNKSREDRVVITGLASPPASISTHAEKKKHYTEAVGRLIELACLEVDPLPKVVDIFINLRKDRGLPLIEARLDSFSGAGHLRREGVRLAKADHSEFSSLFFSNSVTQATRVRIDIMKAIAKKLTAGSDVAYVQGFLSRPVLQYRVKEGESSRSDGIGRSYNFVDAVAKFGSKLRPRDLTIAYSRAGSTFTGALSQYFVVLSDDHVRQGLRTDANRAPLGVRGGRFGGADRRGIARRLFQRPFPDRGVKRAGETTSETPSKRPENELNVVE